MEDPLLSGLLFFLLFGSVALLVWVGYGMGAGPGARGAKGEREAVDDQKVLHDLQRHLDSERRLVDEFISRPSVASLYRGTHAA